MSAPTTFIRDEGLARGTLGLAALEMMRSVFDEQLPRFPHLRDTEHIDDFVNSFFEDKGAGYVNVVISLPDDRAAKQETRKWVERWLVDRARKQPWGALRNRLEKRLDRSDMFTASTVKHHWFLTGDKDTDRPVTAGELRDIAASATVEVASPAPGGSVRLGRSGQLEEMLRRLIAAAGRLHVSDLTRICAERFPSLMETGDAHAATIDVDWDIIEETVPVSGDATTTDAKLHDEHLAQQLLPSLTEFESAAVRVGADAALLAKELGIGRSSAYNVIKKLRAHLIELAGDSERSRSVLAALVRLAMDKSSDVPSPESMEDFHAI